MANIIEIYDPETGFDLPDSLSGLALEIRRGKENKWFDDLRAAAMMSQFLPFGLLVNPDALEDYGKEWRIWDSKPSEEEMDRRGWDG